MLVMLGGSDRRIAVDLEVTATWSTAAGGQHGQAEFTVRRDSPAWDSGVLSPEGGFAVTIPTRYGVWRGLADRPAWSPAGMRVTAWSLSRWAEMRLVGPHRAFWACPAGVIARHAVRDAFVGSVPVVVAETLCAPPLVPAFVFERQPLLDVLTSLSEQTGQTWWIDAYGRFHWAYRQGRFRERWLVDDGGLLGEWQDPPLIESASEVIEVDDAGREWVAGNRVYPLSWPVQRVERV